MKELYDKMATEAMSAQRAVVNTINAKRGTIFKVKDAQPYVDAVNKMKPMGEQAKSVFALHMDSVNTHFNVLTGLTDTVRPEDDPFVEHYQTPPIMEILYEEDPAFRSIRRKVRG